MNPYNFDEAEFDRQYDDLIKRRASHTGPRITIASVIQIAKANGYQGSGTLAPTDGFNWGGRAPVYHPHGMLPREFAGPELPGGGRLFPMGAISLLVALGSTGKTTTLMALASHIAAGKKWDETDLMRRKVMIYSVEENDDELDRKFGAAVHHWDDSSRESAAENQRMISLSGIDCRLINTQGRAVVSVGIVAHMIDAIKAFGAEVVILDHLQGFSGADLNNSDTATMLSQVANEIVSKTGAAVVFAAHTTKSKISAQQVEHGFTTGSLAFENAARQVTGIIFLSDDDAARMGLEATKQQYRKLEMPKNSYGIAGDISYMKTELSTRFNTVSITPYIPPTGSMAFESKEEVLRHKVREYIYEHPCTSKKQLDDISGKTKPPFRASKADVRRAWEELIDSGSIIYREPTVAERNSHNLPAQSKMVFVCDD